MYPFERTIIMGGFQQNAPTDLLGSILNNLKEYMAVSEHLQLESAIVYTINEKWRAKSPPKIKSSATR